MKKKLFGDKVERITKYELDYVYDEIYNLINFNYKHNPIRMCKTLSLPSKETFGDLDILLEINYNHPIFQRFESIRKFLEFYLNHERIIEYSRNTYIHSIIYRCNRINKDVHVDFIVNDNKHEYDLFNTRYQYFCFNDFSGILGIMSKKLNFKYGSEGFFKRYRDTKGNWHDIFLSDDLWEVGLVCLGYDHSELNYLQCEDDLTTFISGTLFFDSKYFTFEEMNQSDRKSYKRPIINKVVDDLRDLKISSSEYDTDYFMNINFPEFKYIINKKINEIELNLRKQLKKYNGDWLLSKFNIKPGPRIGFILNEIYLNYDNDSDENEVIKFVNKLIEVEKSCQS